MGENKKSKKIVIGLTGSWASGCTTTADILEKIGFASISLSDVIEEEIYKVLKDNSLLDKTFGTDIEIERLKEFDKLKKEKKLPVIKKRVLYQDVGNALRRKSGKKSILVEKMKNNLNDALDDESGGLVVIESIKNLGEHSYLESNYGHKYFLININAPYENRKRRQPDVNDNEFYENDKRDAHEDSEYGQQVQKCVDNSDIIILNIDKNDEMKFLKKTLQSYKELLTGEKYRTPRPEELFMTSAYIMSLKSNCLIRKVGAVIVKDEQILASGFNDVPLTEEAKSCGGEEGEGRCYRKGIIDQFDEPEYKGETTDKRKKDERKEIYNKHLDLCRAIHAEERAILQVARLGGIPLKNAVIYTTTFPCNLCAKKIIEVGIRNIYFCEPYPNRRVRKELEDVGIELSEFQGVKARAFFKLFKNYSI